MHEGKARIYKYICCKVLAIHFQNSSVQRTELTSLLFFWQYVCVESGSDTYQNRTKLYFLLVLVLCCQPEHLLEWPGALGMASARSVEAGTMACRLLK